jgi:hypothetical protein
MVAISVRNVHEYASFVIVSITLLLPDFD